MPLGDYYQKYGPMHRRRRQPGDNGEAPKPPGDDDKQPKRRRPRRKRMSRSNAPATETTTSPPPTAKPRPRRRWWSQPFSSQRLIVVVAIALLTAPLLVPYVVHLLTYNRVLPGVSIQGIPVANLDRQSVVTIAAARHMTFQREPVLFRYKMQAWKPTLQELGVAFAPEAVADEVLSLGKRGSPFQRIRELWAIWHEGMDISPRLVIDQRQMQAYLIDVAEEIDYSPHDATLSVAGGTIRPTPGVTGVQMLVDETSHETIAMLQTLTPQQVTVRTRQVPPSIDDDALHTAKLQAQKLLSGTLVLTHEDDQYVWTADRLAELIRISPDGQTLRVELDDERLTDAVEGLAQRVDSGSVEPRLRFTDGALRIVREGREGWRIQQAEAVEVISATLQRSSPTTRTIVLPVEQVYPRITADTLDDLGIVEVVGEGKSSFTGSADYRITNIQAGAARLDGVLIAPDEEFSFNTQIGEINAENGFVEGYAIIGNRTQLEWGGGICQDSTTVFRAAFWAGLPITERHAHPFYISWYDPFAYGNAGDGPGMDATIYTGISDLKFVNDTGHWLLMQTEVDLSNAVLTVQLFGTQPDRIVELDGPYISNEVPAPSSPIYIEDPTRPAGSLYQSDVARNGRDIVIHRVIKQDGVEVRSDTFFTRFKPWPNVFVRGTGEN